MSHQARYLAARKRVCAVLLCCGGLLGACATPSGQVPEVTTFASQPATFKPAEEASSAPVLSKDDLAALEESVNPVYRIGSGDVLRLDVFGRPEVTGTHVVGPDGMITIPLVGDVGLNELTREAALDVIGQRLQQFFTQAHATLAVDQYSSNQVTVLGRVERAGVQKFAHVPTLAEVLAGAGAMNGIDKQGTLTRCAILRGREKLIWVDLKALLNGDLDYNIRMKKGDIVFIPDAAQTTVYVMGSVPKPGSYRLTPRMTVLDALAQAGGPNEDAAPQQIGIYRVGANHMEMIAFSDLVNVSRKVNYALEEGDVLFVPKSSLADFGYAMRQISPFISVLTFGATVKALAK